jgi:23S rRNA-/tRNA-specific pseudouridylate synthase
MMLVNKPPGVLTVPGVNSNSSMLSLVHDRIFGASSTAATADNTGATSATDTTDSPDTTSATATMNPASMIVHRLDMDTSGLVLFSLNLEITKLLHASFANRKVEKEYDAVLMGHLPDSIQTATLDLPLQRDHEHPPFMRVSTPASEQEAAAVLVDLHAHGWKKLTKKRPKPSQTELKVVERGWRRFGSDATMAMTMNNEGGIATRTTAAVAAGPPTGNPDQEQWLPYTRVRLTPITGRTHQLRVHCAALGYPIVGDPTYSLYGEAAPVGGLQDCPVAGAASAEGNDDDTNDEKKKKKNNNEAMASLLWKSRPSLELQKMWTAAYPPNVEPMCLHAAMLQIHHPVSGELLTWEEPAKFAF